MPGAFTYNWSRFVQRIPIKASQEVIYSMWATQHGLETWFLREALFTATGDETRDAKSYIEAGDTYTWRWHGYDDTATEHGEILEADGKSTIKFVFGQAGDVTIRIYEEQGENMVELVQDNIPTDEKGRAYYHMGCSTGWVFYLANLKSILEGGIDLRNKNVALQRVLNS